jgi:aromatic-L-amino-acid decarboxylase
MRKRSRLVALGSAAAHSSTKKAAKILGVRFAAVPVRAEDGYAMTGAGLRETLASLRARGLEPFFLTATLGTTDTCAVDDFASVAAALAEEHAAPGEVWVHVDAAYAGAALVTPEAQAAVGVGLVSAFHSFDTNMHKWLLTNFDASCLFVRDRRWLAEALSAELHVYRNAYSEGGLVTDYRNWQVPLGRRFRSLKVWFVLRTYGAEGLRAYIRRSTARGELFAALLGKRPDLFEILTGPRFALTVFRVAAGGSEEERNRLTTEVYEEVNRSGKIWTTSTVLDGRFAIRVMTGNQLTEDSHVRNAFELIESTTEKIMKKGLSG